MSISLKPEDISSFFQITDDVFSEYRKRGDCKHPVGIMLSAFKNRKLFHQYLIHDGENGGILYGTDYSNELMEQANKAILYIEALPWSNQMIYGPQRNGMFYVSAFRMEIYSLTIACASVEKEFLVRFLMDICAQNNLISRTESLGLVQSKVIYDKENLYAIFQK